MCYLSVWYLSVLSCVVLGCVILDDVVLSCVISVCVILGCVMRRVEVSVGVLAVSSKNKNPNIRSWGIIMC